LKQLMTVWGRQIDQEHLLEEYPRPLMRRDSYVNLNGKWDYAFTEQEMKEISAIAWEGKIVVPFPPEAYLSGVNKQLQPGGYLWYRRELPMPEDYGAGMRVLLHFGAVDQQCKVYVNQKPVAAHIGGYLPFEADITDTLHVDGINELVVCVRDDSDTSYYSRGKQMLKRGGMFYTAQSGIWQTVWMECVPETYLREVLCKPNADTGEVRFEIEIETGNIFRADGAVDAFDKREKAGRDLPDLRIEIYEAGIDEQVSLSAEACRSMESLDGQAHALAGRERRKALRFFSCEKAVEGDPIHSSKNTRRTIKKIHQTIKIHDFERKLWTPERPYLYYYKIRYASDEVTGYFALRTFTVEPDEAGVMRMCLNHVPYFQKGVLDQGYWPDGLYTPPCDNAMIYDILKMKELGFNMLRKHIKIEPQRWYYHCDRLGMIVWQDMVNGGDAYQFWFVTYLATAFNMFNYRIKDNCYALLGRKDRRGREQFEEEMEQTVKVLRGHPSIGTWVIFNEGWGQFDAVRLTKRLRALDDTRVIDSTSGWFDQRCGDLRSQHYYFFKLVLAWEKHRATVLSEFGGFPYRVEGHSCCEKVYGYHPCQSLEELWQAYAKLMKEVIEPEIKKGLSATVYTQLSDVEEEVNGILTYDREVCKHADL